MKVIHRFFFALLALLFLFSIAACAQGLSVAPASALTQEPVQTVVPTPTPSPSPALTEVTTPFVDEFGFTEERKAELNQQIQDFLNYRGEFTREKMSEIMMGTPSPLDRSEVGLGLASSQPRMQGYFFDYFEIENRLFLLMGFDGEDGNRFVTPIEIPVYFDENIEGPVFLHYQYKVNDIQGIDFTDKGKIDRNGNIVYNSEGNVEDKYCYNKNEIISLLDILKNRVINPNFKTSILNPTDFPADYSGNDLVVEYFDEINSKVDLPFGLLRLVSSNGFLMRTQKKVILL